MGSIGGVQSISREHGGSYTIEEHPLNEPRHMRVICIGAGASGLNLAYQMPRHLKNVELVCYEKNSEIGGTWLENRYPGVACDIPSHIYQFLWSMNPDWTEFYAAGPEILEYFQETARKFDLLKYMKVDHVVTHAQWYEDEGIWKVKVYNKREDREIEDWCHFLVNGGGFLNHWEWPQIPGLQSFKGTLLHSANWDAEANLEDKAVAVIGNGSSGIQLTTALQPVVHRLSVFIRNPTWISSSYAQQFAGPNGANFRYTAEQKAEFKADPAKFAKYCKEIETDMNGRFTQNLLGTKEQVQAQTDLVQKMLARLGHEYLSADKLIPDFEVGCRRPTPGSGYLEALAQPNTRLVSTPIDSIVENGIRLKTGETIALDAIVCATGFNTSWRPRFPVIGRGGINLADQWEHRPSTYLSFAANNFPNYFVFIGPNSPLTHGSALPSIEHLTKYLLRLIHKLQTQNYKAVEPLAEALEDFTTHADTFMKRTVWSGKCRSWLKGGDKNIPPLTHPGSRLHWFAMLREPRWEDFQWTRTTANRFAYLGNGYCSEDLVPANKAWYLDDPDSGFESIKY
ncbi:hypothetical protein PV04_05375 [Phialophora macrospora]|uniref:FAD/NAD(P)-binding domain-containing protein n=1 Tax=Phialophora macrospora TaxID=1851006 RepID=A0A0D2E5B8_9EURO|nr:hypothetical protein PV04_05375 [Phialophora macrospora]